MQRQDLPNSVQNLFKIGLNWEQAVWPDYGKMDIRAEHIPALISVLDETKAIWDEYEDMDNATEYWAPTHAWRALGQLRAEEAVPALLKLLDLIDDYDADIVQEELPTVFASIGTAAIPALTDYLNDRQHSSWALLGAAEGLKLIADQNPQARDEVVQKLTGALRDYAKQDVTFNGFLVNYLMELKAVEAAPLVEEAFQAGQVDEMILGDWEDFQVGVGLLEQRTTPSRSRTALPFGFTDGMTSEEEKTIRVLNQRSQKKEKNKRKEAKSMRSKNRKKKKKK